MKKQGKRTGLSVLEMSVALGLMFLSSTFVMGMFLSGSRIPDHAQRSAEVTFKAQATMDQALAKVDQVLSSANPIDPAHIDTIFSTSGTVDGYPYNITATVGTGHLDKFTIFKLTMSDPDGKTHVLTAMRRTQPTPPGRVLNPPVPGPGAEFYDPNDPDVVAGQDIMAQVDCTSCHTGSTAPVWSAAQLAASAAAQTPPMTIQAYIMAQLNGSANITTTATQTNGGSFGNMPNWGLSPGQARQVAAALMQAQNISSNGR